MLTRYGFRSPRDWFRNELRNFFSELESPRRRGPSFGAPTSGVFPAVNIYDDGESFMLRAELPGVDKDDLEISARQEEIAIRGERRLETAGENANYHRREREGGAFRRAVTLPKPINTDKVMATFDNGILEIRAPRTKEATPKKVEIES